jgi:VWFA-related protein
MIGCLAALWLMTAVVFAQQTSEPSAPPAAPASGATSAEVPAANPSQASPNPASPSQATPTQATPTQATSSAQTPSNPASELTSRDEVTTFKVKVNLVLVRVVVRDGKGNPVGGLHQEDFQVLDNGKPQIVSQFAVEGPGVKTEVAAVDATIKASPTGESAKAPVIANHFVAYLFDDVHTEFGDLVRVRDAALRHLDTLLPTDRAAIFTMSGQGNLDFTDDHELLRKALARLQARTISRDTQQECPDLSYYQADLIQNKLDSDALATATSETLSCQFNNDPRFISQAQAFAQSAATRVVMENEHESRLSLSVLQDVLRRIAVMPGQRTVLLLSPGFLTSGFEDIPLSLIDQALRAQIVISAMNSRGLYTVDPIGDVSKSAPPNQQIAIQKFRYVDLSNIEEESVLRDLSDGTGGTYYHNSNDLYAGFQRIASTPEFYYVLGFAPQNLKLDGRFHSIKVVVKNPPKLSVQARKGYYAPKHAANPADEAKQEIEDALFSQEELHDLPVDLHTQFFKASDTDAQLAVLVHIDARHLHYSHDQGRNANQLTIVSGLFDRNGKFITANEKVLDLHLKDDTLANKLERGLTLKSNFDVQPGAYVVRLVVRDAGGQISAANGSIEIP